ncbi:MAG: polysaccharide deacetylase family protein [Candidatus Acidiferrum sp.]|jgi:nucleoside-diphosphate-sugar epimerase/peptidoglycan/xylan/chitin deacetylase (PgdA/CDA1 family)
MKILVTGAAGFLGAALIHRLLSHGYTDIRCNIRRRTDIPKLDALLKQYPDIRLDYCVGDLRYREDALRSVDGVQLIFHLVAGKKGTAADLFVNSVVASRTLLDAVADRKPMRIVLVSSFGVYGVAGLGRGARVNEQAVLEPHPEWRDHYSYSKLRQEQLFWEYQERNAFELVVLRPGVIYGPGGGHFSNRVGLTIGNWQLHFGGSNPLPLSYVDNCAEAVVIAGVHPSAAGQVYNVHDDDLPTCRQYLRSYKRNVAKIRSISVPYWGVRLLSSMVTKYNRYSKGQLPAVLTPYKTASQWGGNRFDNSKLRSIGWKQLVPTAEALQRSFAAFRVELDAIGVKNKVLPTATMNPKEILARTSQRDSRQFVIGAVLGPNSNGSFGQLLAACSSLRRTGRPAELIILDAHDPRQLTSKMGIPELSSNVRCVPDELITRESLQECDVLVSLQDGVPLSVLRAMSSRVPIITTATRVPEALRNQPTLTLIRHGDTQELQDALQRLSERPERSVPHGFVPEENIATHYSETYLWRENVSEGPNGHSPIGRSLIKRALYSTLPNRQLLEHGDRNRPQIAITVDDGPDRVHTPRMLDIFREHAVKATFFVVGGAAEQYPELVLRMRNEGHEVGSHSYSHPYFQRLSWSGAIREIGMTQWVLTRILGEKCKLFRPPHGKLSLRSLMPAWLAGQQVVMWNVDLKDYRAVSGEVETQLQRTHLTSGDIILYHGTNEPSLKALPRVIEAALGSNREAVTISGLMQR